MSRPALRAVVFAGPSLPRRVRPRSDALAWRPPARRGDLAALEVDPGVAVVLVDGYLVREHPPSPTEVHDVVARGHDVWGCSSLGALRAAELRHAGVRGSGWVYERVVDRTITHDDELVARLDPRTDEAVGVFLANVRYGLERLVASGLADPAQADAVIRGLRAVHFEQRTPELCAALAAASGLGPPAVEALRTSDVKRRDAVDLLRHLTAVRP